MCIFLSTNGAGIVYPSRVSLVFKYSSAACDVHFVKLDVPKSLASYFDFCLKTKFDTFLLSFAL